MSGDQKNPLDTLLSAPPTTRTLFHYTSQSGLLGIIESQALWISSIRHLNDSTEFRYAVDMIQEKLLHKLRHERGPWNSYYGGVLDRLEGTNNLTVLVGSFSEHADLLSQWRAYTREGTGFSIGFEFEHLKAMAESEGLRLVKCVYDQNQHNTILEALINKNGMFVHEGECEVAIKRFFDDLFEVAPVLKDPSFAEEHEWRAVSGILLPTTAPTDFRSGKSMLIPYRKFKLAKGGERMPISRVIVGPTPHRELSVSSVGYLLASSEKVDRDTYSVAPSRVPYRSW